jgi:hypothetical protein
VVKLAEEGVSGAAESGRRGGLGVPSPVSPLTHTPRVRASAGAAKACFTGTEP